MTGQLRLLAMSKRFQPRHGPLVRALDRVSLTVAEGEVMGLLGPPGAGKSTLLALIGGRLRPSAGRIERDGLDVALFDEPGPSAADAVRQAARAPGRAALVATSQTALACALCDRVALLRAGRLVGIHPAAALRPYADTAWYAIRVKGYLSPRMASRFDGLSVALLPEGDSLLTGPVADQAALHGLLIQVRDLGLPLLSVQPAEPDLSALLLEQGSHP